MSGDSTRVVYPLFQAGDGGSTPTSPLQFDIHRIPRDLFETLNREWHSRLPECGNCWNGVCYGAEFGGLLYAVAWWSHPVAQNRMRDGDTTLELRRLAIADDAPKNTASRMLSVMRKMIAADFPLITTLISYQDTGVHLGTIYKASGWIAEVSQGAYQSWENRPGRMDVADTPKVRWTIGIRGRKPAGKSPQQSQKRGLFL